MHNALYKFRIQNSEFRIVCSDKSCFYTDREIALRHFRGKEETRGDRMKALILNSGLGSRMGVLTSEHPKCMTEISPKETILSDAVGAVRQARRFIRDRVASQPLWRDRWFPYQKSAVIPRDHSGPLLSGSPGFYVMPVWFQNAYGFSFSFVSCVYSVYHRSACCGVSPKVTNIANTIQIRKNPEVEC